MSKKKHIKPPKSEVRAEVLFCGQNESQVTWDECVKKVAQLISSTK